MFGSYDFSFLAENSLVKKVSDTYKWLVNLYEFAPINFSTLTGWYHPSMTRLTGNPLLGRFSYYMQSDGLGLAQEAERMAKLAVQDSNGRAYCSNLHMPVVFLTRPSDIAQIFYSEHVDRGLMAFTKIFGEHNLVGIGTHSEQAYEEWKAKRAHLTRWILSPKELEHLAPEMQEIIDEFMEKQIEQQGGDIPSLESLFAALTMDVFARTRLGADPLEERAKKISDSLDVAFHSVSIPSNNLRAKLADTKLSAILRYLQIKLDEPLKEQKANLREVLIENFINPNAENLRNKNHLLKDAFLESDQLENVIEDLGVFLLAGHETTARLLQFTMMLLAKHPDVLEKLRAEIAEHAPVDGNWTKKGIDKLTYLAKIIKESLRLYPPTPVIPRTALQDFILANIPPCGSHKEYVEAMEERDKSEDVLIRKGTRILIAPWYTHRLGYLFKHPEEFIPERHETTSLNYKENLSWIPFGIGERSCPGREFAVLEVKMIVVNLISKYDFTVSLADESGSLFQTYIRANLKHKGEVKIHFTPREQVEESYCRKKN